LLTKTSTIRFNKRKNNVDLNDKNIALNEWQRKSEEFDFTMEDKALDDELNRFFMVCSKRRFNGLSINKKSSICTG